MRARISDSPPSPASDPPVPSALPPAPPDSQAAPLSVVWLPPIIRAGSQVDPDPLSDPLSKASAAAAAAALLASAFIAL